RRAVIRWDITRSHDHVADGHAVGIVIDVDGVGDGAALARFERADVPGQIISAYGRVAVIVVGELTEVGVFENTREIVGDEHVFDSSLGEVLGRHRVGDRVTGTHDRTRSGVRLLGHGPFGRGLVDGPAGVVIVTVVGGQRHRRRGRAVIRRNRTLTGHEVSDCHAVGVVIDDDLVG